MLEGPRLSKLFLCGYSWACTRDVDSSCCSVPRAFCHNIQVWILALVLTGCVALGKHWIYPVSQLPHLEDGENDPPLTTLLGFWWGLNEIIHVKNLEQCLTHNRYSKPSWLAIDILFALKNWGIGRSFLSFIIHYQSNSSTLSAGNED